MNREGGNVLILQKEQMRPLIIVRLPQRPAMSSNLSSRESLGFFSSEPNLLLVTSNYGEPTVCKILRWMEK